MFGIYKCPEKKPPMIDTKPRHLCQERFIRAPVGNTSYKYQKFVCQKNKFLVHTLRDAEHEKSVLKQLLIIKNHKHNDKEIYKRKIRERVEVRMNEYEAKIDKRRAKLNDILAKEEREYLTEIIAQVQTFADQQYEEKKQKLIDAKAKKEKERLDFVHEMKFRQYTEKCTEIRPLLSKQKLLEAVAAQKIQREEMKNRKEAEIELQQFWDEVQIKRDEAMKDVVEQKGLQKLKLQKDFEYFLKRQVQEKEAMEERRKEEKQKEYEDLEKLKEKIRQEEIAEKEKKLKLKEQISNTLNEGVRQHDIALKQQTEDELKILRAFEKISAEELRKEEEKIRNKTSTAARDMQLYSQYTKELEAQKMEEERERQRIEKEVMDEIKRKYDEQKFKDAKARNDLFKSCMSTNAMMIEENRLKRERLKQKEDEENEFIRLSREHSNKLNAEAARQKKLAVAKYRSDLDKQVKYAELIKEREREKEKRVLKSAEEEEKKYDKIVSDVLGDMSKQSKFHPFRKVIVGEKCPCPKPIY